MPLLVLRFSYGARPSGRGVMFTSARPSGHWVNSGAGCRHTGHLCRCLVNSFCLHPWCPNPVHLIQIRDEYSRKRLSRTAVMPLVMLCFPTTKISGDPMLL